MNRSNTLSIVWKMILEEHSASARSSEVETLRDDIIEMRLARIVSEKCPIAARPLMPYVYGLRDRREQMVSVVRAAKEMVRPESMVVYNTFEPERDFAQDIDVLVSNLPRVTEMLVSASWQNITNLRDRIKEPRKIVLRHKAQSDMVIHLHEDVCWYTCRIFDTLNALADAESSDGLPVLSHPYALMAIAGEALLSRRCITPFEVLATQRLYPLVDEKQMMSIARKYHWEEGLRYYLARNQRLALHLERGEDDVRLPENVPMRKIWQFFRLNLHSRIFSLWDALLRRSGC